VNRPELANAGRDCIGVRRMRHDRHEMASGHAIASDSLPGVRAEKQKASSKESDGKKLDQQGHIPEATTPWPVIDKPDRANGRNEIG
jgi:hypothetical protein